ncbi:MAG: Aspartate aminotransferase [Anaerocolumna sp.]|jgi:aspartate aminotransferase|nr:Aspartate aminotransferase [Anaerocolumna sp.]
MPLDLSVRAQAVKPSSTLALTARVKELKAQGIDIVGFGAGEPDFNTPNNINEAAIKAINEGFTRYTPASGTDELKSAVCKKFKEFNNINYKPEQIVISNGGKHSLTNVFCAILNPGDEVIIPAPYWLSYPEIVMLAGGTPVFISANKSKNYKITAEQIEEACTQKTKALILNTPNNPSGMIYTRKELEDIAAVAIKKNIYVISDEMYENLVYGDEKHISIASFNEEIYKRTITCCGVSKSYAMTGWRIGYTGSSVEIAKLMGSIQSHQTSNPNTIAQKAAMEALNGSQNTVILMNEEFNRRREYIADRVKKMPYIDALTPLGAFYLFVDVSEVLTQCYKGEIVENVNKLIDILVKDYSVVVIPCEDFGFADHIRLSYAISMEQIKKGMDRIEEFLIQL